MTDGINTTQYELRDEDKEGMSDVYWRYSDHWIKVGNNFWNMDDRCWHYQYTGENSCNGNRRPEEEHRLTKLEMWNDMTLAWRAYNGFYRRTWDASDYYEQIGAIYSYDGPRQPIYARSSNQFADTKDKRLSSICTQAKNAGIVVFTIGFDISEGSDAHTDMSTRASSPSHFHDVDGLELTTAFDKIVQTIVKLKLVG